MSKTPLTIRLGNWLMDTWLPIPFKLWLGEKIKYDLTPEEYWSE